MRFSFIYIWVVCWFGTALLNAQVTHSVLALDGSADPVRGNEPSIAVDPRNPNRTLIGVNTSTVLITEDPLLKRWKAVAVNPAQGFYGDPVMKIGQNGTVYLAHLAKNKQGVWPNFFDRIVFERSIDSGRTFSAVDVGYHKGKMQDKPWFALDEWKGSQGKGNIYLAWTEFDTYGSARATDSSRIRFAKTTMQLGAEFAEPVVISDCSGDAKDDDGTAEGANIAVTPDGVVHVVWSRADSLWYDCSRDQGKTWGKDYFLAEQFGGWNHEDLKGTMRVNGMPFIVSDAKGNVVVVYSSQSCKSASTLACKMRNVYAVVKLAASNDFSEPVQLNWPTALMSNAAHQLNSETPDFTLTEQYSPQVVTSPNRKRIFVAWQDRRRSTTGAFFDVYGAELKVVRKSFVGKPSLQVSENIRLSNTASVAPGNAVFMGDYMGLDWQREIVLAYTGFDVSRGYPIVNLAKVKVGTSAMGFRKIRGVGSVSEPGLSLWVAENRTEKSNTLELVDDLRKDKRIFIWAEWPEAQNFTLEIKMGSQVVFSHVFENLQDSKVDFELPLSRFVPGSYEMVLRKKHRSVSLPVYLK